MIYDQLRNEKKPLFFSLRQAISGFKKRVENFGRSLIFLEKNNRKSAYTQPRLTTAEAIIHILCG
ncbi:hypothetical protein C4F51_14355 [Cellvibrio sp. KB43]|uniref:Uncharacterized protein n=1 Tax=Cellvibrio polysaccharolyticus TaxID=2082724 RepID=A0A928V8D4_9GAMM|nr:hypothetical protein [Cellvibrio polysaccharolyticus]